MVALLKAFFIVMNSYHNPITPLRIIQSNAMLSQYGSNLISPPFYSFL